MNNRVWDFVEQDHNAMLDVFFDEFIGVVKVDLQTGTALVLKSRQEHAETGILMPFMDYLAQQVLPLIYGEDRALFKDITLQRLLSFHRHEEPVFPMEVRCFSEDKLYDWVKVSASVLDHQSLLITARIVNEDHLMRKIVDMFVYRNFDFFILINVIKNTYTMFNGDPDTVLPPMSGSYEEEVVRYNALYVAPEDVQTTTEHMMIPHILYMLQDQECYEFTAGMIDEQDSYHRSRIQFRYYDKSAGLVLCTRTDVTQLFLEEGEKERRLASALREAKHDPMTDLYNKKATTELVSHALYQRYRAQAVIFFIDIDDFKLVNDTLGHQKGDALLHDIGRKLARIASKDGIAGRIGGDEFLLFLPVSSTMDKIERHAQDICSTLLEQTDARLKELPISCSVGLAVYPQDGTEYEQLLYKADQALYDAKRKGKCQYAFYSASAQDDTHTAEHLFYHQP